jgi:ferritin-like metal-binding protein YciE
MASSILGSKGCPLEQEPTGALAHETHKEKRMEHVTEAGINRTGMQLSPIDAEEMLAGRDQMGEPSSPGDERDMANLRTAYIQEADPVGSVPLPVGEIVAGVGDLDSDGTPTLDIAASEEVLMDKLGERLAFERTGTRMYEALITKCRAAQGRAGEAGVESGEAGVAAAESEATARTWAADGASAVSLEKLIEFRTDEAKHFQMVVDAIELLGGDPTAQTPCADIAGVESMGLVQVLSDPKTTLRHSLHAILVAELVDNAGWEELIALAADAGHRDLAGQFETALKEEQVHLAQIRAWHQQATLEQSRIALAA